MPRFRALLALLLAVTWCSAAWHVDLEAVGLILEHRHHVPHSTADDHDAPICRHDGHDPVLVRHVIKDGQIRITSTGTPWVALIGVFLAGALDLGRDSGDREPIPISGSPAPSLQRIWQFVQRCAPESAAPPALA